MARPGLTVDQYGAPVNWSGSISSVRPGRGRHSGARALGKGHRTSERPVTEGHLATPTRSRIAEQGIRQRVPARIREVMGEFGWDAPWTAHEPDDQLPGP